ncbi:MAG: lipid-A-disaccharide synthase, partial [Thermosynechococcaceae cyanobacterium]
MGLSPDLSPLDVLILSNGPGEVMTWVRPTVKALRSRLGQDPNRVRLSVVLSPDPHASGQEAEIVQQFPEVDRVQSADAFWSFLLWGKTAQGWDWHQTGVVLFLGGDQFFAVAIAKRLGYKGVTYAEWEARWLPWIDGCGLARQDQWSSIPTRFQAKVRVVGDLIAETQVFAGVDQSLPIPAEMELLGILPGSKPAKLVLGVPLALAIADYLHRVRPQVQVAIPVAPTLNLQDLERYADPALNSCVAAVRGCKARLVEPPGEPPYFLTEGGAQVWLWTQVPAYELLSQCRLCITTVGANTAELASLAIPMLVIIPTQQLDIMRAWDGIPGLLANLPGLGAGFAALINTWVLKR